MTSSMIANLHCLIMSAFKSVYFLKQLYLINYLQPVSSREKKVVKKNDRLNIIFFFQSEADLLCTYVCVFVCARVCVHACLCDSEHA